MRDMNIDDAVIELQRRVDGIGDELKRLRAEMTALAESVTRLTATKNAGSQPQGNTGGEDDDNGEADPLQSE